MANIKITETILHSAHQSLIDASMTIEDMLPMLADLDDVGFHSVEMWGGAAFECCIRFLDEDPWDRLRIIRKHMPKTKMQMLLGGQNVLGGRHYADDVVNYFVAKMVENGIDIIRVYDALGDIRNLECVIAAAKRERAQVQAALHYTISPAHTTEYFATYAKNLQSMGADSVCIRDTAGLITPYCAYELVRAIKEAVSIPVGLHTHCGSGFASMAYLKAIEAGVDSIDTAISPLALGISQPPTETLIAALRGTPYDTGLDLQKLSKVRGYAIYLREKYRQDGLLDSKAMSVDATSLFYNLPGEVISDLNSQLRQAGREELFNDALREVQSVRKESGYPPLTRLVSGIITAQAVQNVITGERYTTLTEQFRALIKGEYGATPAPIDTEFKRTVIGENEEPIDCRPADLISAELENLRETMPEKYNEQPEDLLTLAMSPQAALEFFEKRSNKKYGIDAANSDYHEKVHPV